MKQERRNLAWACLASAIAHGALIFLAAANFGGMLGVNGQEDGSKENDPNEIKSEVIPIEILPKPADAEQEENPLEAEASETEVMSADTANPPRPDSQDCSHFFGGIGLMHELDGLITNVPAGYPAARAGILPGDILKGDIESIRGKIGTAVEVVVMRGKKTLKFSMIREKICITEKEKTKQ